MNYQIIPGFEDIRIGYVIKKIYKTILKTKTRTDCLCIEKKKQTKTNKKQTALYINLHDITHHTQQHTARKKKTRKKRHE